MTTTPERPSPGRRGVRGEGRVTANLIRQVALDLFSDIGYEATTMRGIARAVGVMPGSIYNHYPSKEEILWDIVRTAMEDLERLQEDADDPAADPRGRLRGFVERHVEFHARRASEARIVNRQIYSLGQEHYGEITAFRDRYERRLRELIVLGVEQGRFAVPDARIASYAILQMGMGISVWYRPDGPLGVEDLCLHYVCIAEKMVAPG
jgi:AcrR family transcriptional regulator